MERGSMSSIKRRKQSEAREGLRITVENRPFHSLTQGKGTRGRVVGEMGDANYGNGVSLFISDSQPMPAR
jgi:hypothetical protein